MGNTDISNIPGIRIGNAQNNEAGTGCTVIICDDGAIAGVDVRGGAPGTRETDLLNPENLVDEVHGVLLSGGSAFGLDAASGIMEYLEGSGIGFDAGITKVPIVIGAVLFDLEVGNYKIRPDKKMGYEACINSEKMQFYEGNVGAGTGASIGKVLGIKRAMKGGLGSYCFKAGELYVGAIVAVNSLGDVIDPINNKIIAGALKEDGSFLDSESFIINSFYSSHAFTGNTTIGAVITNALLNKAQAGKVASMAHNGYARTIRPSHTMYDGDTIFTLSCGKVDGDVSAVGTLAAKAVEQAVINGVKKAKGAYGLKCSSDLF